MAPREVRFIDRPVGVGRHGIRFVLQRAPEVGHVSLSGRAWRRRGELDDAPEFEDEESPRQKQERAVREMIRRTFGDGGF